jgi:hypothetical protein
LVLLDGAALAEFLDLNRERLIPKDEVTDSSLLKKLGIIVARKDDPDKKILEVFLLRSFLYQIDATGCLQPYLIKGNWSDYAKSWKVNIDGEEVHLPFRGKIAFLCYEGGSKKWICHPESSSSVEKIYVDPGELILPNNLGLYKVKPCREILRNFRFDVLTQEHLEEISRDTEISRKSVNNFLNALIGLKLAIGRNGDYVLRGVDPSSGEKLFFDELENIQGDTELERVAKLLLRRDHKLYMQISTILSWLEFLERTIEPYEFSVGSGTKDEDGFRKITEFCSLNIKAVINVVREFSQFGAFIEWYPHYYLNYEKLKWIREYYCFLSCHMDSLGFLANFLKKDNFINEVFKTNTKKEKFKQHISYLLRFTSIKDFITVNKNSVADLRLKLNKSEFIDFNPDEKILKSLENWDTKLAWCPYNVFIATKVPVKENVFKEKVIETLKSEKRFRDPQGHFYYPDFRFLIASQLGLSFKAFDNIFAYVLSKDIDFRLRLWLPVLFGIKITKHKIEDTLLSVVGEPFDSIALRY